MLCDMVESECVSDILDMLALLDILLESVSMGVAHPVRTQSNKIQYKILFIIFTTLEQQSKL